PEEALTAREALAGFTVDAAFAGFAEARRGRVAVGQDADLTLLSADPLGVAPEKIKEIKPVGVVVDGRLAWPEGP
ncbi:MAG: amidohydrolase family protein, partial [Myxococcales bacterium]|nr:amidohydrolase family protein [Myxococcales bacterium]